MTAADHDGQDSWPASPFILDSQHRYGASRQIADTEAGTEPVLHDGTDDPVSIEDVLDGLERLKTQLGPNGLPKRHQPLTLLWAIGRARTTKVRLIPWPVAKLELGQLIGRFGWETDGRTPHFPFLALGGTGLWELSARPPSKGRVGDARRIWLNQTRPWVRGGLSRGVYDVLDESDDATARVVNALVSKYVQGTELSALLRAVRLDDLPKSLIRQDDLAAHEAESGPNLSTSPPSKRKPSSRSSHQGFGYLADPDVRRALEQHAVRWAMSYYEACGYDVADVGATKPYDIHACNGSQEVHIEVKGSSTTAGTVELTSNEVDHATEAETHLVVVDQIDWQRERDGTVTTSGGRQRVWRSWQPADDDLKPLRYRYQLPPHGWM